MKHPHHQIVANALGDCHRATVGLMGNQAMVDTIAQAGAAMGAALKAGHRVLCCGNGGSMADAMHFAEELTGRYRKNRRPLAATAISDPTHLSCVANDFGWEYVFSRYIEAHGRPGDWLLAISTSGNSKSVCRAVQVAMDRSMPVIGLTGKKSSVIDLMSDYSICTPAGEYSDRVQELHIKVIHILIEIVERVAFDIGA